MRLIETIKLINGVAQNLEYHSKRAGFSITQPNVEHNFSRGIVKWRFIYEDTKIVEESFTHYKFPKISSLKLVDCNQIDYSKKLEDRSQINTLYSLRDIYDDIIIVKNGRVTDTSFCNLVFENSKGLFTPNSPLLVGTKLTKLISENIITPCEIKVSDICNYNKVILINAMIDLSDNISVDVSMINGITV